jgi:ATP-binding cassette, subfamily B, multidrug efflux pump
VIATVTAADWVSGLIITVTVPLIPAFAALTAGRSVLLITHDPDGLDEVDEIIVLNRGQVAERGTHGQLLARRGHYWRMFGAKLPGAV